MLTARFEDALTYAASLHACQVRKGTGIPYISHLLAVCALVLEDGGSEDEAIAALLHDAAEDHGGEATLNDIRERFGDRARDIVGECSDTFEDPKPPWHQRKERYVAHLEEASPSALRVSLADKLHNVRSTLRDHREIGEQVWERFNANRDEIVWYYRSLAEVFARRRPGRMADELVETVGGLDRLDSQPAAD